MKLFANWFCRGGGGRPSKFKATTDGRRRYAGNFRPFCHRHALSSERKNAITSFVSGLLVFGRPAAVVWPIVFRIVDAVNRVLRGRTGAHVFEEALKRIIPLWTHGNAATSVAAVSRIIGIVAPPNHTSPNSMFWTLAHPVFGMAKACHFFVEATTASRASVNQMARSNDHGLSASAAAQPSDGLGFPSYRLQRRQSFEPLLGEIFKTHAATVPQKQIEPQEA